MRIYRDVVEDGVIVKKEIFYIIECTYSGKDMGERSITATFYFPSPVDFKIGDYMELQMHELLRDGTLAGSINHIERFYIYTMPTIKKTARVNTHGKGFEHIVTFYPAQYELSLVQMRNLGDGTSNDLIYTGFDSFSFVGGAKALMDRIILVLNEAYGKDTWKYYIANEVDEEKNKALEMVTFSFSGNSVMDALLKLNDKEGVNTTFFINNRTIYVGFKRAYFCRAIDNATIDPDIATQTFNFQYGKTSHENVAIDHGGLFEITKSVGKETPITKLFAHGASRNLNRYYCSDRIGTGRYVNRLMLPSFQNDGKTEFILSQEVDTYGIREGSKTFEEIYPSLRYVTYGDIRQVKYCIKIKASGITGDSIEGSAYPIARVQCYRVIESETKGVNTLIEAAPPDDLAIYVRALDKVVKVVLCGGATDQEAISKQIAKDGTWGNGNGRVPATTYQGSKYIPGSCFLVDDMGFSDTHLEHKTTDRSVWFTNPNDESAMGAFSEEIQSEIKLHQINYTDDFWLTDLYVFSAYNQTYFNRLGYSAYSYPVLNSNYTSRGGDIAHDSVLVNEVIEVEPVVIDDTSAGIGGVEKLQHTFDVYLRDIGFKIDEQNDFGKMVFVLNGALKVSFLDGNLVGREFECKFQNDAQSYCVCAYNEDGTLNDAFFEPSKYNDRGIPERAFDNGAIWRLRLERINLDEPDYSNLNLIMPNTIMNAQGGDHVVLLDLFMPDIYVHAAENRLLREARHYLAANDRGKIQYAVAFDKVRMQQIPAYALQMREGLKIRMKDSDLEISTKNRVKKLFEGSLLTRTSLYETTYDSQPAEGYYYTFKHRDYYYLKDKGLVQFMSIDHHEYLKSGASVFYFKQQSSGDSLFGNDFSISGTCYIQELSQEDINNDGEFFAKDGKVTVRVFEKVRNENGTWYKETDEYRIFNVSNLHRSANGGYIGECSISAYVFNAFKTSDYNSQTGEYEIHCAVEYDVRYTHKYDYTIYTPNTHLLPYGVEVYAPSKVLLEFSQNKHYDITIVAKNTQLLRTDVVGNPKVVLINNLSDDAKMYSPNSIALTHEDIDLNSIRFTFSFDLDSSFNDTQDYYPALIYVSDNNTEYVETIIESIIESDVAGQEDLDYAEFTIQDVTIKITDSSNRTFAQPIKEISATLSEQNNASAWGTLMNRVEKTEIEGEENSRISQTLVNSARRYRQQLLNLRNSIFDPDGTCNDIFLQMMMLQVGADSMNYYLDNTRQDANGTPHNYSVSEEDDGLFHFCVYNEDRLHHLVYTEHGGTWKHIGGNVDFTLNPNEDGTYPTYFVAIKCKQYSDDGEWVCEPIQHKVNEEEGYYYFNWGILSADVAGVYTLVETRGNAYMYGDNLIAGRISDLAKRSYFDLTRGEFALGESLSYIQGILKIGNTLETSTELEDGMVVSNVLKLKDENGNVVAGFSGAHGTTDNPDNVFAFAGGTYEEAVYAAQNGYKKPNGKEITTLVQKDGKSKIGIFKIDDTIAVVDVPNQGKVIIDASSENGGIYVKDSEGVDRAAIISRTLEESGMLPTASATQPISESGAMDGSCTSSGYYMQFGNEEKIVLVEKYYNAATINLANIAITVAEIEHTNTQAGSVVAGDASFRFEIISSLGDVLYSSEEFVTSNDVKTISITDVAFAIPSGYYKMCLIAKSRCSAYSPCQTTFSFTYQIDGSINYSNYKAKTVICKDGLLSAYDSDHYFMVKNSASRQNIYAKGLSNKKGSDGSGELYVSSDFIAAFSNFLDTMSEYVQGVRTVGINVANAEDMIAKISSIKAQLTETSLIANS